jgi:hypothetical protein
MHFCEVKIAENGLDPVKYKIRRAETEWFRNAGTLPAERGWYKLCTTREKERNMKALIPITLAVILSCNDALLAQEETNTTSRDAKRKVVFGIKVGVNRSNVYDESGEAFSAHRKHGYAAGMFLALPLGSYFGFQPEIVLQQKGFDGSGRLIGNMYLVSRTTTHLDFPLQVQFKPTRWLTIVVGPQYSVLLKQTDDFTFEGGQEQRQRFQQEQTRRGTAGTIAGLDLNFGHLVLSGRTGWDLAENPRSGDPETPHYRNKWLQGTIGYRFY